MYKLVNQKDKKHDNCFSRLLQMNAFHRIKFRVYRSVMSVFVMYLWLY